MNNSRFIQATCDTSKAVGRNNGIKVRFSGDGAYTDGSTITLPSLPPFGNISDKQMKIFQGYRDHETMHILLSHMEDYSKNRIKRWVNHNEIDKKLTFNCLEDMRIERCANEAYFGMASNIHAVNQSLGEDVLETIKKEQEKWKKKGKDVTAETLYEPLYYAHMVTMARARMTAGFEYDPLFDIYDTASDKWKQFADRWAQKINSVPTGWTPHGVDQQVSLDGVKKVFSLVPAFIAEVDKLNQQKEKKEQQQQQAQGNNKKKNGKAMLEDQQLSASQNPDQQGQSEEGKETRDSNKPKAKDKSKADAEVNADQSQAQEGKADRQKKEITSSSQGKGMENEETQNYRFDKEAAQKALVNDISAELSSEEDFPYSSQFTEKVNSYEIYYSFRGDLNSANADKLFGAVKDDVIKAKRGLEIALQARNDVDMKSGALRGKLDSKRLVEAVTGSPYVYRNRKDGREMDTTVTFLMDTSGSMLMKRMFESTKTAYVLCKACESVGCRTEIFAFPGHGGDFIFESKATGEKIFKNLTAIKTLSERIDLPVVKGRLEFTSHRGFGYTPIAEAVTILLLRQASMLTKKKILIVLTDGDLYSDAEEYLSVNCKKFADKNGIHLFGIGLGVELDKAFKDCVKVECGDISRKVLTRMAQIIAEEK